MLLIAKIPSNTSSISVLSIATNCPWKYPWSTLVVTVTSVVDAGILGSVVASVRVKLSIIPVSYTHLTLPTIYSV